MRFTTIWGMPSLPLKERISRTRDWIAQEVAHRLPVRIRYWSTMQALAKATMGSPNVPETPLDDILRKLEAPKNLS